MSINLRDIFSPPTHVAIKELYADRNWQDIDSWIEPEIAAEMFFRLRALEDSPDYFPRGKWATIQQLESALETYYKEEVATPSP